MKAASSLSSLTTPLGPPQHIRVVGARMHNLKNIHLSIPRFQITVITGVSGSGKSSLAFDTLHAEGQRRYLESLSLYARQFVTQLEKPDVDHIDGLSPTIAVQQKIRTFHPRSTVGTLSGVYDYLRILYAQCAHPLCNICGLEIAPQSALSILDDIVAKMKASPLESFALLAPRVIHQKGSHAEEMSFLLEQGYEHALIDGAIMPIEDVLEHNSLKKTKHHSISVVIDRFLPLKSNAALSATKQERLRNSLQIALGLGRQTVYLCSWNSQDPEKDKYIGSSLLACRNGHTQLLQPTPLTFSFNSSVGACPKCEGGEAAEDNYNIVCGTCKGSRLKPESLLFLLRGLNIHEVASLSLEELIKFIKSIDGSTQTKRISDVIASECLPRLEALVELGCGYLSLHRRANTLSAGESQRIRLASQIGSHLRDITYILDEPSVGLHPHDHQKLMHFLRALQEKGNTIILVEHDEETMRDSDFIIDMGPGAGAHGGEILFSGTLQDLALVSHSTTGDYLYGRKKFFQPAPATKEIKKKSISPELSLNVLGAYRNNLKNIDIAFPLGKLIGVCGVSGAGKSSLVTDTLGPLLQDVLNRRKLNADLLKYHACKGLKGWDAFDKVITIDQSPVGNTPRSNPATYIGVFQNIRALFASLPESKIKGFTEGRFSFNVTGGRCEACKGAGIKIIQMYFLADASVVCEECRGLRYNAETLKIQYRGKNIQQILALTAQEAKDFFKNIFFIFHKCSILEQVGLGYLQLGQSLATLSGGEAQRLKIGEQLIRKSTGKTLYIFDEPTVGLHFQDVQILLENMRRLVNQGNTVILIEHHTHLLAACDYLIELGPYAGSRGGKVLVQGSVTDVIKHPKSMTGSFLAKLYNPDP